MTCFHYDPSDEEDFFNRMLEDHGDTLTYMMKYSGSAFWVILAAAFLSVTIAKLNGTQRVQNWHQKRRAMQYTMFERARSLFGWKSSTAKVDFVDASDSMFNNIRFDLKTNTVSMRVSNIAEFAKYLQKNVKADRKTIRKIIKEMRSSPSNFKFNIRLNDSKFVKNNADIINDYETDVLKRRGCSKFCVSNLKLLLCQKKED